MSAGRLDRELVRRGLARSRARAQELIRAGVVSVGGAVVRKAAAPVGPSETIELASPDHPLVGRGGLKLEEALGALRIRVSGRVVLDVGASTGGFVDCLLRRGARLVHTVDVGRGMLARELRDHPRVNWREGCDVRDLDPSEVTPPAELITVDCSFISLSHLFPALRCFSPPARDLLALVKPQFELGPGRVDGKGVVRSPEARREALTRVVDAAGGAGFIPRGSFRSPVPGREGNVEHFVWFEPAAQTPEERCRQ